jgi:hypothetical protein
MEYNQSTDQGGEMKKLCIAKNFTVKLTNNKGELAYGNLFTHILLYFILCALLAMMSPEQSEKFAHTFRMEEKDE